MVTFHTVWMISCIHPDTPVDLKKSIMLVSTVDVKVQPHLMTVSFIPNEYTKWHILFITYKV